MLTHLPWIKWPPFCRRYFQMQFCNETFLVLIKISLNFVSKGPVDKKYSIGLDNGLAPNRRQDIIWTNADPIHWRIYAALGGDELTLWGRDKMAAIFQTTFSNAFPWMKIYKFQSVFHWSLFPRVWRVTLDYPTCPISLHPINLPLFLLSCWASPAFALCFALLYCVRDLLVA